MGAFHEHGSHAGPTWPAAALDHNLPLRASCGLTALYAAVNRTRGPELAATAVAPPVKRLHETFPDGTLCLAPDMPLLARRYRFMHAISETDLSQVICATDTYCECERAADGRRQPLVAIKVLNAKHWIIGAQEYTRLRLLRKRQDAEGVHVPIAGATSCFEVGCHFCILQPLLATLDHEAARCRLCGPPGAAPSPPLAGRSPGSLESVERVDEATSLPPRLGLDVLRPLAARLLGALAYLRQHDVIHADLKPDNLMADRGGGGGGGGEVDLGNRVRLIDFSNAMTPAEARDAAKMPPRHRRDPEAPPERSRARPPRERRDGGARGCRRRPSQPIVRRDSQRRTTTRSTSRRWGTELRREIEPRY